MKNKIIPYNPKLKVYARELRKNSTLAEVLLWQKIKSRTMGVQFHRQVPLLEYIVDFYCHELKLAIEIDGDTHEYKYDYDVKRQGRLEKLGVSFIRFSDLEVKKETFSVGLALEEKVRELLETYDSSDNPKVPSRGQYLQEQSLKYEKAPAAPAQKEAFGKEEPTPPCPPQGGNRFGKKEKLKSRKLIERLFTEGKSIKSRNVKLLFLEIELPQDVPFQVGVTVPKKNFKSSVKRNRIKRLLREGYRLNKPQLFNNSKGNFAFLFLYLGKEMPDYHTIEHNIQTILQKFLKEKR